MLTLSTVYTGQGSEIVPPMQMLQPSMTWCCPGCGLSGHPRRSPCSCTSRVPRRALLICLAELSQPCSP